MEWIPLIIFFAALITLLFLGLPVAISFMAINVIGVIYYWGAHAGLQQLIASMVSSVSSFTLLPLPLFILMGEVMMRSGVGAGMMDALDKVFGRFPGRLSILAVVGGALFAALNGSAMASTAMLGTLLVPEMMKRGYKAPMVLGPVLASGGLAMMIPPTQLGVLLATLGHIPIGSFMVAIIIPGIVMAANYAIYIIVRCTVEPSVAPPYDVGTASLSEKLGGILKYVLPVALIMFLVVGVVFIGVATPSEAAALGAIGCYALALSRGGFTWKMFTESINSTIRVSIMVLFILAGATMFSQLLSFSGTIQQLVEVTTQSGLSPMAMLVLMQFILLLLGMFMDPISIMMITVPIYFPIAKAFAWDPMWFGVIFLLNMQMATTSPPFGLSLFVMRGVTPRGITMRDIYLAALPFLACDAISMALLILFPGLVTWLPSQM
jgi:tripartite ATP-independent transporter DctM subunit